MSTGVTGPGRAAIGGVLQEITESLRSRGETARHADTGAGQLGNHFSQRCVFATDGLDVRHAKSFKGGYVYCPLGVYCVGHDNP